MKRGLTQTLMTVAIALLGYQALALAPVITDIPSPVVGNANDVTSPNVFVWPDAIALDNYVSDDTTPDANIKWYYYINGTAHYSLNGVASLSSTESATDPANAAALPEGKRIDNQVLQSERNDDSNARTVTIRNTYFSPFTGTGATPAAGVQDSQVISLYASDGSAYSTKDVMVYSENNGIDHFGVSTPFLTKTFTSTTEGFSYTGAIGSVTSSTSGATAICFNVTGLSYGLWVSPFGIFTVEQNQVYKIRANMNSSQATAGKTPFWDIYVDNFDNSAGDKGLNLFGADLFILDSPAEGSANAVIQKTAGTDFQLWFAPIAIGTTQWDTNFSAIATGDNLKTHVTFRLMDVRTDLGSNNALGMLCLGEMDITKYPISAMTPAATAEYSVTNFKPNTGTGGNTKFTVGIGGYGSTPDWTGGVLTMTPSSTSQQVCLDTINPATDTNYTLGTSDIGDDFPVVWASDTLYMITYNLAAPSTPSTAVNNPFDAIYIGVDVPSNECLMETYVTQNGTNMLAMPKTTAQPYRAFWWSHKVSASANPFYNHFHPRLTVVNNGSLGGTANTNAGGLKVSGCEVRKVTFQ